MDKKCIVQAILPFLIAITVFCKTGRCVECFVCSYSPKGNTSRVDGCTDDNFTAAVIDARTCEVGCESVSIYDTNGNLESFHRNCVHGSAFVTNECLTTNNLLVTSTVCACDWSYCNHAVRACSPAWPSLIFAATVVLVYYRRDFPSNWYQTSGT